MKTTFDSEDLDAIANRVVELLIPLLRERLKEKPQEDMLTVRSLADYLRVSPDWVYKQVSLGAIPYIKVGRYNRFKKTAIDRWVEMRSVRSTTSL